LNFRNSIPGCRQTTIPVVLELAVMPLILPTLAGAHQDQVQYLR
jgi:hypothetical protein